MDLKIIIIKNNKIEINNERNRKIRKIKLGKIN
jgi:hypothetical protein